MRSLKCLFICAVAAFVGGCLSSNPSGTTDRPAVFTLKVINSGSFPVTAVYVKPVADTADWGSSLLPVPRLDSLSFVRLGGFAKGPTYAVRAAFDSLGTTLYLVHGWMPTNPDTISFHAAMETTGWSIGHCWGLETWAGEKDVTP